MIGNPSLKETLKRREDESKETRVVRKFIRTVWEHVLVTEEVRKHREQAILKFQKFFIERRFNLEDIVGILAGSSVWGVGPHSDFDYLIIVKSWENHETITKILAHEFDAWPNTTYPLNFLSAPAVVENVLQKGYISREVSQLLTTPDECIAGNITLARDLRVQALNIINSSQKKEQEWEIIQKVFLTNYVEWRNLRYPSEEDSGKRGRRFKKLLADRSVFSKDPERFEEVFLKQLQQTHLPDFEIYRKALTELQGALSIH